MKAYIRSTAMISPQKTFCNPDFLSEVVEYSGNRLNCIEPDYRDFIDARMIRRMSRIIRMGVAAASACLQEGGVDKPDAIITGTAYGCLQDTDLFLTKMIEQNEELLTPTAFIQSTHNTIGAQIGLMLSCHGYNNTFVHSGFSFESALLDALMLLTENPGYNILVGAADEIIDDSHKILSRLGLYKQEAVSNMNLYETASYGTIAGEGAGFFLLGDQPSFNDYARLEGLHTFYNPKNPAAIKSIIGGFLEAHDITPDQVDLVITGKNGDTRTDKGYIAPENTFFRQSTLVNYKNLCGEYPTSISFALWLAANIIKKQVLPRVFNMENIKPRRILIYNHYQDKNHTLVLLSAC